MDPARPNDAVGTSTKFDRKRVKPVVHTTERLPSLRQKRDLTLGGVPKRQFTPTIPTRRVKKEPSNVESPTSAPQASSKKPRKDRKERKERKKELVTSASVFSMGPAEIKRESISRSYASSKSSSSESQERHTACHIKQELNEHQSDDEEEPMDTSSNAVPSLSMFSSSLVPPVVLPLDDSFTDTSTSAKTTKSDNNTKVEHASSNHRETRAEANSCSAAQIFTPSETSKGLFLLIQFPDRLPLPSSMEQDDDKESPESSEHKNQLNDLPEGLVGKLRVYQSGQVKLVLGETALDVTIGTRGGFLQQLASINTDTPSLTVLGQLSHRLICSPDLESLLQ